MAYLVHYIVTRLVLTSIGTFPSSFPPVGGRGQVEGLGMSLVLLLLYIRMLLVKVSVLDTATSPLQFKVMITGYRGRFLPCAVLTCITIVIS